MLIISLTREILSVREVVYIYWRRNVILMSIRYVGVCKAASQGISPWTYTKNPIEGSDWRVKAKGSRVVSFMLWLYCDDTSGNLSKKWNKLNSFLWTAAGLPRSISQCQYNVHFLATSNKAPPLEMLDGIVEQLE